MYSRHSCSSHHSNNGAPVNSKDRHLLQRYLTNSGNERITNKSTENPKATGIMEALRRHLKEISHMAGEEREEPYPRLNNYIMQFSVTPHATKRKYPAELLVGRRSYGEAERPCRYLVQLDETNIVAADKDSKGRGREVKDHDRTKINSGYLAPACP